MTTETPFDESGHCRTCHLDEHSIGRVERLIAGARALSMRANPTCGHTSMYRSIGIWTAFTELSKRVWIVRS